MLQAAITDAAVAEAKRRSHESLQKGHVLAALLKVRAVQWPDDQIPSVDLDRLLPPTGKAIAPPAIGDDMRELIDGCTTPDAARRLAFSLIQELSQAQTPTVISESVASPETATGETSPASSAPPSQTPSPPPWQDGILRAEIVDEVVGCLRRLSPVPVLLHGRPGAGRTTILRQVATRLKSVGVVDVRLIKAKDVLVDPDTAIAMTKAPASAVLLLDDADLLLGVGQQGFTAVAVALGALLAEGAAGVVISVPTTARSRFTMMTGRLGERCVDVEVPPVSDGLLESVLASVSSRLRAHHSVAFEREALSLAASPPGIGQDRVQPGLAFERLDAAAARVARDGRATVTHADVLTSGSAGNGRAAAARDLAERLATSVLGQDHAVERLARRLALTRISLDLRPERPDGVFLFVGPTGVGKTALAKAVAQELFGNESSLIRLDMSEYSEPWAISRLTGPQPGYVGSTEPDSWLTTRVRNQPQSVVLLDEIEKAHPDVWNVFLQVFDAGRLTDSRGDVADFSSTVVILTSNLGTGVTERKSVGFTNGGGDSGHESRVLEVVAREMRPELLNRIDGTIVFHALDRATIREIADSEIKRLVTTLGPRGFVIEVDSEVTDFIADDGYDERMGARHVQRAIERHILETLAEVGAGSWRAVLDGGTVRWDSASVM